MKSNMACYAKMNILVAGDPFVGKSSLVQRYVYGTIQNTPYSDLHYTYQVVDGRTYKLDIWELGGDRRTLLAYHFRGCSGVILVFDVASKQSFESVLSDLEWLKLKEEYYIDCVVPVLVVGAKCDCPDEEREISRERVRVIMDDMGLPYIETNAQTGVGVQIVFEMLLKEMIAADLNTVKYETYAGSNSRYGKYLFSMKELH